MPVIKFFYGNGVPIETHKARVVQKLSLTPVRERADRLMEAGCNMHLLKSRDVFLDLLTDSGVNAMSDLQTASMLCADDSYAGSTTFYKLASKLSEIFGSRYFLPAHQGRACENIICKTFVKEGTVAPMNFHFTTTRAHILQNGGEVAELLREEGTRADSSEPFKGDIDIGRLEALINERGADNIPFLRMEAGTNLIGGQPFSLANLKAARGLCADRGIMVVLDASLLADNLYFIKLREEAYRDWEISAIAAEIAKNADIIYFSGRKLGCARGGGICVHSEALYNRMRDLVPLYEGFLTYGGMSAREMEALAVGLDETTDIDMISQGPIFIEYMTNELKNLGIPVVTPAGGLGAHLDAERFLPHVPRGGYPGAALAAALYVAGGIRGTERGALSEDRLPDGSEKAPAMELLRLALPRRVFTLSHIKYAVDRIRWLFDNRAMVGGLEFDGEEPKMMRFFTGRLRPLNGWLSALVEKFAEDFGEDN